MFDQPFIHSRRAGLAVLAATLLLGACASVDLGGRYDPPPVRMPQSVPPPVSAPTPATGVPQTLPVPPSQPIGQPLPPIGATPVPQPQPVPPAPVDERAHLVTLSTRMDGASAVPPTRSPASGQLDAIYDSSTRLFRWIASWNNLSGPINGVRFHGPAGDGQIGPATLLWPAPFGPRYEGRATLTPEQAVDLMAGRWYLNVATPSYPSGEIRGQLRVVP